MADEAKHTPGPWVVDPTGSAGGFEVNSTADPWKAIVTVEANCLGAGEVSESEAEANAQLIAAAPDLLAVCKRIVAGGMSYPKYDRDLAAAAVAKAEGK